MSKYFKSIINNLKYLKIIQIIWLILQISSCYIIEIKNNIHWVCVGTGSNILFISIYTRCLDANFKFEYFLGIMIWANNINPNYLVPNYTLSPLFSKLHKILNFEVLYTLSRVGYITFQYVTNHSNSNVSFSQKRIFLNIFGHIFNQILHFYVNIHKNQILVYQ